MLPKERFPQFRNLKSRKSASCGHCSFRLISPSMRFPPQAVIDGSSPSGKGYKREKTFTVRNNLLCLFFFKAFLERGLGKTFFGPGGSPGKQRMVFPKYVNDNKKLVHFSVFFEIVLVFF
ncbi:MAG: hypothetical protein IK099_00580 [Clostridia bacterium]|nr:hypothetical protein [Clostridia bacterium]